jgi:hypothetical protein
MFKTTIIDDRRVEKLSVAFDGLAFLNFLPWIIISK